MTDPLDYLIVALAAWRIAYALVHEDVFTWLRDGCEVKAVTFDRQWPGGLVTHETKLTAPRFAGKLLTCVYCSGTWISAVFVVLWMYQPELRMVIMIFAISGLVNLLQRWHNGQ